MYADHVLKLNFMNHTEIVCYFRDSSLQYNGADGGSLTVEKATRLGPQLISVVASGRASGIKLCFAILVMKVFTTSRQMTIPRSPGRCCLNACVCVCGWVGV